ncbi:MCP four helix bundle domain-containing protein [Flavitalea antarctica]
MFKQNSRGDRRRHVFFFFALLCSVILLEYSTQSHFDDLDHQMSSLYRDRLMPANYLMRLNDQLHKKQRWQMDHVSDKIPDKNLKVCNDSISALITLYQKTYLTQAEAKLWSTFKDDLRTYNAAEANMSFASDRSSLQQKMHSSFDEAINTLSSLSELQTQEGYKLQRQSKSILNGNFLQHMLEVSLLFVIGILAIQWLRTDRPVLVTGPTAPSAN